MNDKKLYNLAKRRVTLKKISKVHLIIYIIISILLFVISFSKNENWWIYPVLSWGIGLIFHGISLNSSSIYTKKVEKELEELKKQEKIE